MPDSVGDDTVLAGQSVVLVGQPLRRNDAGAAGCLSDSAHVLVKPPLRLGIPQRLRPVVVGEERVLAALLLRPVVTRVAVTSGGAPAMLVTAEVLLLAGVTVQRGRELADAAAAGLDLG